MINKVFDGLKPVLFTLFLTQTVPYESVYLVIVGLKTQPTG